MSSRLLESSTNYDATTVKMIEIAPAMIISSYFVSMLRVDHGNIVSVHVHRALRKLVICRETTNRGFKDHTSVAKYQNLKFFAHRKLSMPRVHKFVMIDSYYLTRIVTVDRRVSFRSKGITKTISPRCCMHKDRLRNNLDFPQTSIIPDGASSK